MENKYSNHNNNETVKITLSDGQTILMDCDAGEYDGEVTVQSMTIAADKAFGVVKSLAKDIKDTLKEAKPNKAKVEFSLELSKEDGDIFSKICNVSGKGGLKITLERDFSKE